MTKTKNFEKIKVFFCPECETEYEDEDIAEQCCPRDLATATRYKCICCGYFHETEEEADNCCEKYK